MTNHHGRNCYACPLETKGHAPIMNKVTPTPDSDALPGRILSPRRKTTQATSVAELAVEQLAHFSIDPDSPIGQPLLALTEKLYSAHTDLTSLWNETTRTLSSLPREDRLALFNAKKFTAFQLAKLLDLLQNPSRAVHQSLGHSMATTLAKGPYPTFDNVAALFSATPVITRTATYIFACTEWIDDAFQGREFLHEIYSRLLNPTSIALANHIVDLEAGPQAADYLAWNFNSGMAAIDGVLSHLLGYRDIVITSRNVYGGTYQLLNDWFAKSSNLDIAVDFFDGFDQAAFLAALAQAREKHAGRLADGRHIYVFLESPCNPHGVFLDLSLIHI